jgi:hypothetical protein
MIRKRTEMLNMDGFQQGVLFLFGRILLFLEEICPETRQFNIGKRSSRNATHWCCARTN